MSAARGDSDIALVTDWTTTFADLVAAHHADLLRLAYGMVGDVDTAADVVQSAWAAAWQHRVGLRDNSKVRGWLLTITANHARKALRWRRIHRMLPFSDESSAVPGRSEVEGRIDLVAALQRLPIRDRQILVLRYALGESSPEIGRQVGLSDSGVRVRLSRLMVLLRKDLAND
jgi:RNA polymerase sigma factor (sigma-70 family)